MVHQRYREPSRHLRQRKAHRGQNAGIYRRHNPRRQHRFPVFARRGIQRGAALELVLQESLAEARRQIVEADADDNALPLLHDRRGGLLERRKESPFAAYHLRHRGGCQLGNVHRQLLRTPQNDV